MAADGTGERRLTASNDAWLGEVALAPTRRFRAAAADGTAIDGWLTGHEPAPGEPPRPLILQVHGGPHYPIGERFSTDAQALAGQGYLVLTANPRGSQGYGAAFATVTRGAWGGLDHDDLMTLVDAVVASGAADPARLAIMGESYGGYMTMWSVGRTDQFRAAIAENGISNLTSIGSFGSGPAFWRSELGGDPWSILERALERSPISAVERIRTPLLLIHAELDGNCPIDQSEELFAALRGLGRDVSFVRIPGEGHLVNLFGRPSRRRARLAIIDAFLARHLG